MSFKLFETIKIIYDYAYRFVRHARAATLPVAIALLKECRSAIAVGHSRALSSRLALPSPPGDHIIPYSPL